MKYLWAVFLVVSNAHAMGSIYPIDKVHMRHPFYYEGDIYDMRWDTQDINLDFFQECRNQTTYWRLHRTKDQIEHPYNHVSEYINATACDRTVANKIAERLYEMFPGTDKKSKEFVNFVTAYVNGYFYKYDTAPEYEFEDPSYKNVFDTFNSSGDCEDLAMYVTALLAASCVDTAFLVWEDGGPVSHATSSCTITGGVPGGTYVQINGKEYYVIEAVGGGGTKYLPYTVGQKSSVMKGSVTHYEIVPKRNCN